MSKSYFGFTTAEQAQRLARARPVTTPRHHAVDRRGDRRRLFVGSGHYHRRRQPAAHSPYLIAGTLVVLVMPHARRNGGRLPDTGSFSTYADRSIGRWASFTIGWLYWWFWVLVIPSKRSPPRPSSTPGSRPSTPASTC